MEQKAGMVQDKVVIVTGAGRGIGQAIAKMMAACGAKVVVNDIGTSVNGEGRDLGPAQDTVDQITAAGGQAVVSTESVAQWDGACRIAELAMDTYGRIDCVVNNAAVLRDVIFHKMMPEDWEAVIGVGLNGSFYVSRAVAPYFRKQESGSFVHITDRWRWAGQLRRDENRPGRTFQRHCAGHGALPCALELRGPNGIYPDDRIHPDQHAGAAGSRLEAAAGGR